MDLRHGLVFLLFCSAYSYQFRGGAGFGLSVQDPEREWERMEAVISEEMSKMAETLAPETKFLRSASGSGSSSVARKVPQYRIVSGSKDYKEDFKPEKGARPLPNWAKEMLLKTATPAPATGTGKKMVEVLCHLDRVYVRVRREVFKTRDAYKYLKLGSCPVNSGNKVHYYLLYRLTKDCGFKSESKPDYLHISNSLQYKPTSLVLRDVPFNIPLKCDYPRFFHSYEVGFHPKLQGGTVFKALQPKSSFTLTPQDASGNEITGAKTYTLGQPMYFEVKQPESSKSGEKRIYINKCFVTASTDPNSNPKYTVIDNKGCMVDGKMTQQSKFLRGTSKTALRFSVAALIFKDKVSSSSTQQLYMHCDVFMGTHPATPSAKACNYDQTTNKWKELYGHDSVCSCCDSSCSSTTNKASGTVISSHSWKVDLKSKDGYDKIDPRKKNFDAVTSVFDDPSMAEHEDFLNHWESEY